MTPATNSTEQEEGWVEHDGGDRPVPHWFIIEARLRSGGTIARYASTLRWAYRRTKSPTDIIAYRIVEGT